MGISLPQFQDSKLLTHSAVGTFKTCPRKYWLKYRVGLVPRHDSDALRLGSAVHIGLEELKSGRGVESAETVIRDTYAATDCPKWMDAEAFDTEQETAVALVRGYASRYANDMIVEYLAVELSFDLPIINPTTGREARNYRSAGKIDGICKLPDGRIALIEHKTTSDSIEPESDYWKRLMLDAQISRYFLAARALGYEVETTVYDVIRKPAIKPKAITKADRASATADGHYFGVSLHQMCPERETPELFGARLCDDLSQRPEFYFARVEIPRLESDLTEYQAESWIMKNQIRESELEENQWGSAAWPRNTAACTAFGRCVYLDVCRGMCGDPTQEIPAGFRRAAVLHPELATANSGGKP